MNKKISLAALAILLLAVGCKDQSFKKTKEAGIEYRIFKRRKWCCDQNGDAIEFQVFQYYNDSLMANPFETVAAGYRN